MRRRTSLESGDKILCLVVSTSLIILILCQLMLLKEPSRRYLSLVDRLEGEAISLHLPTGSGRPVTIIDNSPVANPISLPRPTAELTIRMLNPLHQNNVFLTVNGSLAGDFRRGEAKVEVADGDYVEVDARQLGESGQFLVVNAAAKLVLPAVGTIVEGKGCMIPVGRVKLKP